VQWKKWSNLFATFHKAKKIPELWLLHIKQWFLWNGNNTQQWQCAARAQWQRYFTISLQYLPCLLLSAEYFIQNIQYKYKIVAHKHTERKRVENTFFFLYIHSFSCRQNFIPLLSPRASFFPSLRARKIDTRDFRSGYFSCQISWREYNSLVNHFYSDENIATLVCVSSLYSQRKRSRQRRIRCWQWLMSCFFEGSIPIAKLN